MMTRRRFIRVLGAGGAAGVLLGSGGYWAATRGQMPASAIEPWTAAGGSMDDPRLKFASFATLAPNPHNIQPWLLKLEGADAFTLHVDLNRLLPHTDPPGRQILIGQGTFLELFRMAAAEFGYRAEIAPFPDGPFDDARLDGRPVARVRLLPDQGVQKDPLFAQVLVRRSNKEPYDKSRPVLPSVVEDLGAVRLTATTLQTTTDPATVQRFRDLTEAGLRLEIETPHTLKESIDLMRIGPKEVAANPDGIDLLGPMMWWGVRAGMVSREEISDPDSQSFQIGLDMARDQAQSAMAHAWLVSPDNSRMSQLETGMDYVRLNLKAAQVGLAIHPMSQVLQEYPEMSDLKERAFAAMGVSGVSHPQMLVRLGHAVTPGPSPRRPVGDIIAA